MIAKLPPAWVTVRPHLKNKNRLRWVDHLRSAISETSLANMVKPRLYWKKEIQKLARCGGTYLLSQLLRRLRQEDHLNLGGRGCSKLRSHRCTPAWVTEWDSISKKKKRKKKNWAFLYFVLLNSKPWKTLFILKDIERWLIVLQRKKRQVNNWQSETKLFSENNLNQQQNSHLHIHIYTGLHSLSSFDSGYS